MSVKFYDKYNRLLKESNKKSDRCEENTLNRDMIIYLEVEGGNITLNFELKDKNINKWFPYQYDDGVQIVNYTRTFKPGKYRLILPTTKNEDTIAVIFESQNEYTNANIYIVPNFTQY